MRTGPLRVPLCPAVSRPRSPASRGRPGSSRRRPAPPPPPPPAALARAPPSWPPSWPRAARRDGGGARPGRGKAGGGVAKRERGVACPSRPPRGRGRHLEASRRHLERRQRRVPPRPRGRPEQLPVPSTAPPGSARPRGRLGRRMGRRDCRLLQSDGLQVRGGSAMSPRPRVSPQPRACDPPVSPQPWGCDTPCPLMSPFVSPHTPPFVPAMSCPCPPQHPTHVPLCPLTQHPVSPPHCVPPVPLPFLHPCVPPQVTQSGEATSSLPPAPLPDPIVLPRGPGAAAAGVSPRLGPPPPPRPPHPSIAPQERQTEAGVPARSWGLRLLVGGCLCPPPLACGRGREVSGGPQSPPHIAPPLLPAAPSSSLGHCGERRGLGLCRDTPPPQICGTPPNLYLILGQGIPSSLMTPLPSLGVPPGVPRPPRVLSDTPWFWGPLPI